MSENKNLFDGKAAYCQEFASDEIKKRAFSLTVNTVLELKQAFELLSYRIISQDDFCQRVKDCCDYFLYENFEMLKEIGNNLEADE